FHEADGAHQYLWIGQALQPDHGRPHRGYDRHRIVISQLVRRNQVDPAPGPIKLAQVKVAMVGTTATAGSKNPRPRCERFDFFFQEWTHLLLMPARKIPSRAADNRGPISRRTVSAGTYSMLPGGLVSSPDREARSGKDARISHKAAAWKRCCALVRRSLPSHAGHSRLRPFAKGNWDVEFYAYAQATSGRDGIGRHSVRPRADNSFRDCCR